MRQRRRPPAAAAASAEAEKRAAALRQKNEPWVVEREDGTRGTWPADLADEELQLMLDDFKEVRVKRGEARQLGNVMQSKTLNWSALDSHLRSPGACRLFPCAAAAGAAGGSRPACLSCLSCLPPNVASLTAPLPGHSTCSTGLPEDLHHLLARGAERPLPPQRAGSAAQEERGRRTTVLPRVRLWL